MNRTLNLLISWAENGIHVFCLAFVVFCLTLSPSVGLWDAGEFVAAGSNLSVGHPPGAPLYWLMLRLLTIWFPPHLHALACNMASALCCAGAATLLSLVTRSLLLGVAWGKTESAEENKGEVLTFGTPRWWAIMVAQTAAGLAWAFCSSVWAVATECEVYGAAALLSFAILYASLRWRLANSLSQNNNKWLALALLLTGLAMGIHWIVWLMLPMAGVVVFSAPALGKALGQALNKKKKPRGWATLGGLTQVVEGNWFMPLVGLFLGSLMTLTMAWLAGGHLFDAAAMAEVAAVNILGLPRGLALALGIAALPIGLIVVLLVTKHRAVRIGAEFLFLLSLGSLTYLVPLCRASGGVCLNIGNPCDAQLLTDYMGRTQYGKRPLLYGPTYASKPNGVSSEVKMFYVDSLHAYVPRDVPTDYAYDANQQVLLPRMTLSSDAALWAYMLWASPDNWPDSIPSPSANLRFMMRYQMGHMMGRYVLWNFCGRQNDRLGDGGRADGNFITGLAPLDDSRLCLAPDYAEETGRVCLYCIPLLLLLGGLVISVRWPRLLALLTLWVLIAGPALAFYLNMPPYEPRERDYVFLLLLAALFIFVAIALGWAALALGRALPKQVGALAASVLALGLPIFSISAGWEAQDRSSNTLTNDLAVSLLDMCPPDAIVLVGGDNDTYPLWYAQEVLGHRTDVRVVNFGLLGAHWYVSQLSRASHHAAPLRMAHADLAAQDQLAMTYLLVGGADTLCLNDARIASRNEFGTSLYLPTNKIRLTVADTSVVVSITQPELSSAELLLLEMMEGNPDRTFCFMPDVVPHTLGLDSLLWDLGPLAYVQPHADQRTPLRTYQILTSALRLPDAATYALSADEAQQLTRLRLRQSAVALASQALLADDRVAVRNILHTSLSSVPMTVSPTDTLLIDAALLLHAANDPNTARQILTSVAKHCDIQAAHAQKLAPTSPSSANLIMERITPAQTRLRELTAKP